MKSRRFAPSLVRLAGILVLISACVHTTEVATPDLSAPPPLDPAVKANVDAAHAMAANVEAKSKRTEKAEGKQDLVKDSVAVKTDGTEPVVEQLGEASWYGKFHQGRKTASGTRFDQRGLTAAHPSLPLGTRARVTNLDNGKSVEVKITDRGPYARGRDIDLSKAAAQRIGVTEDGAAAVRIEVVVTPGPETSPQPTKDATRARVGG